MFLIDRIFLNQIIKKSDLYIDIKRTSLIKIRNKITLIRREIYIIDNLSIKAFIEINIIKFEEIVFDINKNLVTINSYNFI